MAMHWPSGWGKGKKPFVLSASARPPRPDPVNPRGIKIFPPHRQSYPIPICRGSGDDRWGEGEGKAGPVPVRPEVPEGRSQSQQQPSTSLLRRGIGRGRGAGAFNDNDGDSKSLPNWRGRGLGSKWPAPGEEEEDLEGSATLGRTSDSDDDPIAHHHHHHAHGRRWNFSLLGNPTSTDVKIGGLRVTSIGGWGGDGRQVEPITMMSLKKTEPSFHPRHVLQRNHMYFVRLNQIVDPSNFFMEFIMEPPKDGSGSWDESLQKFYSDPDTVKKYRIRTLRPVVGQQYAYYNEELGKWERVRVHQILYFDQIVYAVCLDRLNLHKGIPFTSLVELHPRFGNWHRYPMNGTLRDVVPWQDPTLPLDPEEAGAAPWSAEAIEYFRDYAKDKVFMAHVVTKEFDMGDTLLHASNETRFVKLTVILFEVGAKQDIPVNAMLVEKGYATPVKGMANWKRLIDHLHSD